MRLVLFLLSVSALADSLTLKGGRVLSGTYLGGSTTAVPFLVGDRVETYSISAVDRISFSEPGPASAAARTQLDSSPHDTRMANETTALTTPDVAEKQQPFCDVLQSYRESIMRYTNEPNAIRRAATRKPDPFDWEDRIMALMGTSGRFDSWHGTVRFHVEG
jgi:hypothetical protein